MKVSTCRVVFAALLILTVAAGTSAFAQDVSSSPTSLGFPNTYLGMQSGSKALLITNLTGKGITITAVSFSCPEFGLASGVAPFSFGATQNVTHYSMFFQPTAAGTYNCDFVMNMSDGTQVDVPISGTGLVSTATASITPSSLSFPNQAVGTTSAPQTITIKNTGTGTLQLQAITLSPSTFTTNNISMPQNIPGGNSLPVSVYYTPNGVKSEAGAIDFTFGTVPDTGSSLSGNGVASTTLTIANSPILPQATQKAAYQATFTTSGGTGPYTWVVQSGSLPSGLSLSSAGEITGTLASTVATGNYSFTVKVTDQHNGATATNTFTITVVANLNDNCNDLSFNDPDTNTPLVALTDLGTGTFETYEGGLYPNGSNVRPSAQDSYGVTLAEGIVPLDSNGNYDPNGKYVMMAIGESTEQNEFNRFIPIASSDPNKNSHLVFVNGAQGGATPSNFTSSSSVYWSTILNNYLPQNGVTANQVVVIVMEDTDGIATGTFPSDVTGLQSEYETVMQTMHTLFPNLKMVYFSSRVYAGYSNGVGNPDNPEPYAYEVGYAVKWAIQDQLNGNPNLNYNPANGPVVAPWMSWGPYYWSNGMLGRSDGLVWDCADFSADGTHPSTTYGQLKVATALLQFLKTDDTTIPWYLASSATLAVNGGNNQSGNPGTTLPTSLSVLATNGGKAQSGVTVNFNDNGGGGTFSNQNPVTNSSGIASTKYTLPSTNKVVTISATSSGYSAAIFTETSGAVQLLTATSGNNQSGNVGTTLPSALTVTATKNGSLVSGLTVNFNDNGAGGTFSNPTAVTNSSGVASTNYTLPATPGTITITASSSGYTSATFTETATSTGVTLITVVSGQKQSGTVGTTLPLPLVVKAKNSSGGVVSGASITFSDGSTGTFSPNPAITGSNGEASTNYTLPTKVGSYTVTAADGSVKTTMVEHALAGSPSSLSIVAGNNQSANPNTTLHGKLIVEVADQRGNPLSGITVTFNDNGAGGTLNPQSSNTVKNGEAETAYTTGPNAGTVTVSATTSTLGPTNFTVTVK